MTYSNKEEQSPHLYSELKSIHEILSYDIYLHRFLMLEIINNNTTSESTTFEKLNNDTHDIGRSLIRTFGTSASQAIVSSLQKRNNTIRNYYVIIKDTICKEGICTVNSNNISDITSEYIVKLDDITKELISNISSSFTIDSDNKIYQKLYSLLSMYNKELINQAKSYAIKQYDISMNCSKSLVEINNHLINEFSILMTESQQKLKIL